MDKCSCCENKAKYEIAGDKLCGKHIGYGLDMHLRMGSDVTVRKIEKEDELIF